MISRVHRYRSIVAALSTNLHCHKKTQKNQANDIGLIARCFIAPVKSQGVILGVTLPVPDFRNVPLNGPKPMTVITYSLYSSRYKNKYWFIDVPKNPWWPLFKGEIRSISESSPRTGHKQARLSTGQPGFHKGDVVIWVHHGEKTKLS